LLLTIGPFLHAHYGQSHYEGFHDDAIQRVVGISQHQHHDCVIETSELPESIAVVIGSSLTRELEAKQAPAVSHLTWAFTLLAAELWQSSPLAPELAIDSSPPPLPATNIWVSTASPSQAPPALS
jgi:hypothetical protein